MLRFAQIEWLYLLPLFAVLALVVVWRWGQLSQKRQLLADEGLLGGLSGELPFRLRKTRWLLGLGAMALWAIALANPQWGTRTRIAEVQSTEVVIALDISESMLTEDVRPSRLDRAKNFLLDLTNAMDGEQVGLVLFAGQAYLQMPLTTDYGAAQLLIRSATPTQAPTQGTNFAAAISLSRQLLQPAENELKAVRRIVVLVSDGENHEALAEETLRDGVEEGLRLYAVGVGTEAGGRIPAINGSRNAYKRGRDGGPIMSKFDPAALQALAEAGDGRYFDLSKNALGVAKTIASAIAEGPSSTVGEEVFLESASYYQVFLFLGILLWLAAWWAGVKLYPKASSGSNKLIEETAKPEPAENGGLGTCFGESWNCTNSDRASPS